MAVSKRLRYEVFRRDNHTCVYCGRSAPDVKLQPDHVVPEALGGRTEPANLVTACEDCNAGKSATPPDAATVESVSDSAVRWAGAMSAAADAALADLTAREETREEFLEKWNSWKAGDKTMPLPGNWADSVDRFLATGLPMQILLDCVDRAMSKPKIKAADLFRYMCGIAWSRVNELQKAAEAIADGGSAPSNPLAVGRLHLAQELLNDLHDDEREHFLAAARGSLEDGTDPYGDDINVHAAYEAFGVAMHHRWLLLVAVKHLLELLPSDDVDSCRDASEKEATECLGVAELPEFERPLVLSATTWRLRRLAYFRSLSEQQRANYLTCYSVAHGLTLDAISALDVAEYAWDCKERGGFALPGMCIRGSVEEGQCPHRAAFLVEIEACRPCAARENDACAGHPICEDHTSEIVDERFTSLATGIPILASSITELEGVS
jgi:hypothetical protein